jgi:hypothetical protein
MESQYLKQHQNCNRAFDIALWMSFKYRLDNRKFGVVQDKKTKLFQVIEKVTNHKPKTLAQYENYSQMSYEQIQVITSDVDPLSHWEEIMGMFSVADGELLRFILLYKIPLDKIIRYELAARGHDQNHLWVGYKKAQEIWLK